MQLSKGIPDTMIPCPTSFQLAFQEKEKRILFTTYLESNERRLKIATLSEDALLSKKILIWECEMNLKAMEFPQRQNAH